MSNIGYSKRATEARIIRGLRQDIKDRKQAHDDIAWAVLVISLAAFAFTFIFWS